MPVQTAPNLNLGFGFDQGEGNWKTIMDANLVLLDCITQLSVIDKDLVTDPASPADGDRYIIAGVGGLWSPGTINDIARFRAGSWEFFTPNEGWISNVEDEALLYVFRAAAWVSTGV